MPDVADLKVKISAEGVDKVAAELKRANSEVTSFASGASKIGGALGGVASTTAVAATALGGLAVGGIAAVVKQFSSFESTMSQVKGITRATGTEFEQLSGLAKTLGKETSFSAREAAQGMAELAKGGVSVADIMGGGLRSTLALAAAGQVSLGEAAEISANALTIFGLKGTDLAHVADQIAGAANASSLSVGDFRMSMAAAGSIAAQSGMSFDDLAVAIAVMGANGIKGSDAGTSLKTMLNSLQPSTEKQAKAMRELGLITEDGANAFIDANGSFKSMGEIAGILESKLQGMTDAQKLATLETIFGSDAMRAAAIFAKEGATGFERMAEAMGKVGAEEVARTNLDNVSGSVEQLLGSVETLAINFGEKLAPGIRRGIDALGGWVDKAIESKEVQQTFETVAKGIEQGIDGIIRKANDPSFQRQVREWGTAALETGRKVASLARDVSDTLGPPLRAAVTWFSGLDEAGKKNVVTFAAVAGGALAFRNELGTLLSVGNSVVRMFGEKLAAKRLLTTANQTLAGSAGNTAKAFAAAGTGAKVAGAAIAFGAGVTILATAAVYGGITALNAYDDANGGAARGAAAFAQQMDVNAFAIAHGADELNNHGAAFTRFISANQLAVGTADQMAVAWNAYLATMERVGVNVTGLTPAMTAQAQAQQTVNRVLGEGLIAGTQFNDTIGMLGGGARALAATLPPLGSGLGQAATGFAEVVHNARPTGIALQEINSYGSPAQSRLNEVASAAQGLALNVQSLRDELAGLGEAFANNTTQMSLIGTEAGQMQGWLGTLQGEWDALDQAVAKQGYTTDQQAARYAELAPLIQYLNGRIGDLGSKYVGLTEEQVKNWMTMQDLNAAIAEGGAKATGAQAGVAALANATKTATGAGNDGATAARNHAGGMDQTAASAAFAAGAIAGVGLAVRMVPKEFTVTAKVDITQALANIDTLSNRIPRSPAKEGPFRKLPNWHAIYEGLAPAGNWAISTLQGTTSAMAGALDLAVDEGAKKAAEVASAIAKAIGDVIGASRTLSGVNPGGGPSGEQFAWLSAVTTAMVGSLAEAAARFDKEALEQTERFAEAASKVGGSIKNTLEGLKALAGADFARITPSGSALGWFTFLAAALVANFEQAAAGFTEEGLDAASGFGEAAGKIGGSVGNTLAALKALATTDWANASPSGSALGWFTHLAAALVANFAAAALGFSAEGLQAASDFAEAAGKVGGSVGNALAGLKGLATADWANASPSGSAMGWFTYLVASLVQNFATAAQLFTAEGLESAGDFGEAASKVGGSIGNTLAGLKALATADFAAISPTASAMAWFVGLAAQLVAQFATAAAAFEAGALQASSDFAESASKVGGSVGATLAGLQALAAADYAASTPDDSALAWLTATVAALVAAFARAAAEFKAEGLAGATDLAESAGKVAGMIGPALAGLAAIADGVPVVGDAALDDLMAGIRRVVAKFAAMASELDTEGMRSVGALGEAASKALGAAKTGLEFFAAVAGDKDKAGKQTPIAAPSAAKIDEIMTAIRYVVGKFAAMATEMEEKGVKEMQSFAAAAGTVLGAANTGADLLTTIAEKKLPPMTAVDALAAGIAYVIAKFRELASGIGAEGLAEAQRFATGALDVATTTKAALDLFPKLAESKGLPQKALQDIADALDGAIGVARVNVQQALDLKTEARAFADAMGEAAALFARGLSFGGGGGAAIPQIGTFAARIPALADGGIVTRPTLALVGERGPEAVIPLSRAGDYGGGGGGDTYRVTFTGPINNIPDLENAVVASLDKARRRGRVA